MVGTRTANGKTNRTFAFAKAQAMEITEVNARFLLTELTVAEAGGGVVVDHADGLHESVADGGADEAEAAFFQVFAYGVGYLGGGWEAGMSFPRVLNGLAVHEGPDVFVEGAEFFLDLQESFCVADGGLDFQAIAYDSGIF